MCYETVNGIFFFHHGDDFVIVGTCEGSAWLVVVFRKVCIVNDRGVLGLDTGDKKDMI